MNYLIARFGEASTYATLTALLAAFGLQLDPGLMQHVALIGTGVAGLAGILLKDKGSTS